MKLCELDSSIMTFFFKCKVVLFVITNKCFLEAIERIDHVRKNEFYDPCYKFFIKNYGK